MDVEQLIGTMIQGTLTGRRKRSHRAGRYLRGGGGSLLNAGTLLTIGGLVWGAIETMQRTSGQAASPAPQPVGTPPPSRVPATGLPPLPNASQPPTIGSAPQQVIPEGAAKLIRLMVSAARADGDFRDVERTAILDHARKVGAEALVAEEIGRPTPLGRIVEGITETQQRADMYLLAFGIVRGDENVSGAERIYLAQLAALLGLEPDEVEQLERDAASKIDAAGQEQTQ